MAVKTRKWVLLVDDEEEIREELARQFYEIFGKEVKIIQAKDGVEAENKLKNQTFHLIVTDIRMPRKDGEELIEIVREGGFNETTPIIAMSAYSLKSIEKKFPFVSYLDKPITKEQLSKAVKTYFKLGSTEKMIDCSIFSSLLDSSVAFLKEALSRDDFQVGEMSLKSPGKTVTADFAAVIQVGIGKVSNTFSVLCSKQTLEQLRDKSEKLTGTSLEVIMQSLGYVILKYVLEECGIIDSNEVYAKDISQDSSLLTDKTGILVPVKALNIDYQVFATTNLAAPKDKAA